MPKLVSPALDNVASYIQKSFRDIIDKTLSPSHLFDKNQADCVLRYHEVGKVLLNCNGLKEKRDMTQIFLQVLEGLLKLFSLVKCLTSLNSIEEERQLGDCMYMMA